jgi:GTP pyrophosphokinase
MLTKRSIGPVTFLLAGEAKLNVTAMPRFLLGSSFLCNAFITILTTSKGMVMHRTDCSNLSRAKDKNAQWLNIDWQADECKSFEVKIIIDVVNQRGTLASIANIVSKLGSNIEHIEVQEKDNSIKSLELVISVADINHLQKISQNLSSLEFVKEVSRF